MKNTVRVVCVFFLFLLLSAAASCGPKIPVEVRALAEYLQWFDEPEKLPINVFEKAEFENEIYYYLDRGPSDESETESTVLIIVYEKKTGNLAVRFRKDMEAGLHGEVLMIWEQRENLAGKVTVFSEEEIRILVRQAVEYCQ